jgi:hypothetical protein
LRLARRGILAQDAKRGGRISAAIFEAVRAEYYERLQQVGHSF